MIGLRFLEAERRFFERSMTALAGDFFFLGEVDFFTIVSPRSASYRRHGPCRDPGACFARVRQGPRRISSSA